MQILILTDRVSNQASLDSKDTRVQVNQVKQALRSLGHEVAVAYFSMNLAITGRTIERSQCDLVFNLVENLSSASLLCLPPLLCQSLGVRCCGGSARTLLLTAQKPGAKRLLVSANLPTPRWVEQRDVFDQRWYLGIPLILKPIDQEASLGIDEFSVQLFSTQEELSNALKGGSIFAEEYIEGREFSVSLLPGGEVLPVAELCFIDYPAGRRKVAGYEAKWEVDSFAYQHTQRRFDLPKEDSALVAELKEKAVRTYQVFGSTGPARVDVRVDGNNQLFILEMNSNPCLERESGYAAAALQAGISYEQLIERLALEA